MCATRCAPCEQDPQREPGTHGLGVTAGGGRFPGIGIGIGIGIGVGIGIGIAIGSATEPGQIRVTYAMMCSLSSNSCFAPSASSLVAYSPMRTRKKIPRSGTSLITMNGL